LKGLPMRAHKPPARLPGDNAGSFRSLEKRAVANASTDIVLGVALAADPEKYRVAAERLRGMSAEGAAGRSVAFEAFSASVEQARGGAVESPPSAPANAPPRAAPSPMRQTGGDAFAQLEAFVLQTFIQSMLPKNASHVFGKGTAGEIWRSMLAEKLGHEVARSGQLGIATRLMSASAAGALWAAQDAPRQASEGVEPSAHPSASLEQG
jgi:hypothetical protein